MTSAVALASFTSVDKNNLLTLMRQALGRSITGPADKAGCEPPLQHMMFIAAIKEPELKPQATSVKPYLTLFHAGFIIAADEYDFTEILEIAGLPAVVVDTITRGIKIAYVVGSVSQWRDAMLRGGVSTVGTEARKVYNLVYKEFNKLGIAPALDLKAGSELNDKTFTIEVKRP